MESNELTELTSKIETDSQIESKMTAEGVGVRGWRDQEKKKKDSWTWITV